MPFEKGHVKVGGRKKGERARKTVWVLQSLAEHGYDYEKMLVGFLNKAATGDKVAYDMAALLVKLVPHLANAPKHDVGVAHIETLVINRIERPKPLPAVEQREESNPVALQGHHSVDAEVVKESLSGE